MKSTPETDLLVVGGGPAGLAAAIAARRAGLEVILADSVCPPIDKACGEGILPDGLEALEQLGIRAPAVAARLDGIRFVDDGGAVEANFLRGGAYGIRRTTLHEILVEGARQEGVNCRWGVRVGGIDDGVASLEGQCIRFRWLIGADGQLSRVRRWAGLDCRSATAERFGFRCHYRVAPWSRFVEVHWSDIGQAYVTPIGAEEICVVLTCGDASLRLPEALDRFPELRERLSGAQPCSRVTGAVTMTRRLTSVCRGRVALVGDASGSVDAITGEGLASAFRQAQALAEALRRGNLEHYQSAHRQLMRRPYWMSKLMLVLDKRPRLRRRFFRALRSEPRLFSRLLAVHTGAASPLSFGIGESSLLCWRLLTA